MKIKLAILVLLLVSVFLVGCTQSATGNYAAYNQPQGQGQPQVGGGCGVAPSADYSAPSATDSQPAL